MIVVKLNGGLGNQMFQYAAGKALAEKTGSQLALDLSWFEQNKEQVGDFVARPYQLDLFAQIEKEATVQSAAAKTGWLNRLFGYSRSTRIPVFREASLVFDSSLLEKAPPVVLEGFWQSELYFSGFEEAIRRSFSFPNLLPADPNTAVLQRIKAEKAISVHVRRSDYLNKLIFAFHGICSVGYYQQAIALMKEEVPGAVFYFFSDDPLWVKENLVQFADNWQIVEGNTGRDAWKDMYLMSHCTHHIIANSSFSWWGAWLNRNNNKKIIAPEHWFANPVLQEQAITICPKTWIRR